MLQEAKTMSEPSLAQGSTVAAPSSSLQDSGRKAAAQLGSEDTLGNAKPRHRSTSSICASMVAEGAKP